MTKPSETKPTPEFKPQPPIIGTFDRNQGRKGTTPDLTPTISLPIIAGQKKPFTFGVNRARLILANLDAIKQFVADAS